MKNWLIRNQDERAWAENGIQPDGVHFEDLGAAYKAAVIAFHMFPEFYEITPNRGELMYSFDTRTDYRGGIAGFIGTWPCQSRRGADSSLISAT